MFVLAFAQFCLCNFVCDKFYAHNLKQNSTVSFNCTYNPGGFALTTKNGAAKDPFYFHPVGFNRDQTDASTNQSHILSYSLAPR